MRIPWAKPYIGKEELREVVGCFDSGWLTIGPKVKKFERILSEHIGIKHCIAVNSGTAALDVALKVLKIKFSDEVIVPAFAYIATANAVLYQNAIPVFADIDRDTYNLDPADVAKKITKRTKCIIAIDYGGQAADFQQLREVIGNKKIYLVEDGAPGLGGEYNGSKLCSLGDISITSFHMAKIFASVEGGMVFTENDEYNKVARMIRSQGEDSNIKYYHPVLGHNYRLSDLHASVGIAQIGRFRKVLEKREQLAQYYSKALAEIEEIKLPIVKSGNKHAWFLYAILVNNRNKVKKYLAEHGISTNISWPLPVYKQEPYRAFNHECCSVTEKITKKILCLPMFYEMTNKQQDYVIEHLKKAILR